MKRIAIFSPNFPPELGACSLRIFDLAKRLKAEGHHIEIYTTLPNYPHGKVSPSYRKHLFNTLFIQEKIQGIDVFRFSFYPSNSSSTIVRLLSMCSLSLSWLFSFVKLKRQNLDIIFVQSPPILPVFVVWFLAKVVLKKKFILNVSDLYPRVLKDLGQIKNKFVYNQLARFEKFIYQKADSIIGQSEEIIAHVKEITPAKPLYLYRNGVETRVFKPKSNYEVPSNAPIKLVYAGLLGIAQGMHELVEQINWEELNTQLYIFGQGNEYQKIQALIQKSHLKKYIILEPAIPFDELSQRLCDYDVALVAQRRQIRGTVPSKIYDAMAVGLPVLLCGSGESKNLVEKNQAGIVVEAGDYNSLKQAITNFKQMSTQERQMLGQRGFLYAKSSLEQKIQFEGIKTLFEQ